MFTLSLDQRFPQSGWEPFIVFLAVITTITRITSVQGRRNWNTDLGKNSSKNFQQKAIQYPLGSGAIESANIFICHVRLKRSAAWWKIDNANNVPKLRCAKYNEKFDDVLRCMRPLTENSHSIALLRSKGSNHAHNCRMLPSQSGR